MPRRLLTHLLPYSLTHSSLTLLTHLLPYSLHSLGYGLCRNTDCDLYIGEFHNNKYHTSKSDSCYVITGTASPYSVTKTLYNDRSAVALLRYAYGSVYQGTYSLTHSPLTLLTHPLTSLTHSYSLAGAMKDGLYSGRGKYLYSNGSVYDGYWSRGKRKTLNIDEVIKRCVVTEMDSDAVLYEGEWRSHWKEKYPNMARCKLIDVDNKVLTHPCLLTHSYLLTHAF